MASAPKAVHDSKPTRIRIATVDCMSTFSTSFGKITEVAVGWTNCALSGLATRYQMAMAEKPTSATSCTTLMTRAVIVEPFTPRSAM